MGGASSERRQKRDDDDDDFPADDMQGRTCTSTVGRYHHNCQSELYQRALTSSKEGKEQQTLLSHVN